uniref:DUF2963 domain-containing protein n=2 Tax=Phytoplasma australiense TaxID=59748 RepID=Q1WM04_PHYAS|nr:unknown [Candidatus Phytoplasma australiense]
MNTTHQQTTKQKQSITTTTKKTIDWVSEYNPLTESRLKTTWYNSDGTINSVRDIIMQKKRKLILKIWFIFLSIILFLLLLLLGLNLPKLPKLPSKEPQTIKQTQTQLETKNISDFNFIQNLINLMNKLNNYKGQKLDIQQTKQKIN